MKNYVSSLRVLKFLILFMCVFLFASNSNALRVVDGQYVFDKLEDAQLCFDRWYNNDYCLGALDRWLDHNPDDVFKAAKIVRQEVNSARSLIYFSKIKGEPDGYCDDPDLKIAVIKGLSLPTQSDVFVPLAKEIAFNRCFDDLKHEIKAEINNQNVFANSCKKFLSDGSLGSLQAKRCKAL